MGDGPCYLCGATGPDVLPAYLRVVRATRHHAAPGEFWANLRCRLCDDCSRRGAAIVRRRMRAISILVFARVAVMFGAYGLAVVAHNDALAVGILLALAPVTTAGYVGLPFYLGRVGRAVTPAYLGRRDADVRARAGIRAWSAGKHLVVLRDIPAREGFVDVG